MDSNNYIVSTEVDYADEAGRAMAAAIDRDIIGHFIPELWSNEVTATYKEQLPTGGMPSQDF